MIRAFSGETNHVSSVIEIEWIGCLEDVFPRSHAGDRTGRNVFAISYLGIDVTKLDLGRDLNASTMSSLKACPSPEKTAFSSR